MIKPTRNARGRRTSIPRVALFAAILAGLLGVYWFGARGEIVGGDEVSFSISIGPSPLGMTIVALMVAAAAFVSHRGRRAAAAALLLAAALLTAVVILCTGLWIANFPTDWGATDFAPPWWSTSHLRLG